MISDLWAISSELKRLYGDEISEENGEKILDISFETARLVGSAVSRFWLGGFDTVILYRTPFSFGQKVGLGAGLCCEAKATESGYK